MSEDQILKFLLTIGGSLLGLFGIFACVYLIRHAAGEKQDKLRYQLSWGFVGFVALVFLWVIFIFIRNMIVSHDAESYQNLRQIVDST